MNNTPTQRETREIQLQSETLTHYEPKPGVHVIIKREQRGIPTSADCKTEVFIGNYTELETIKRHGQESTGLRHFFEHIAAKTAVATREITRLLTALPRLLHLQHIYVNAETSLQSMRFVFSAPQSTSFSHHLEFINRLASADLISGTEEYLELLELERERILHEATSRSVDLELTRFVHDEIFTGDSFLRQSDAVGTDTTVTAATLDILQTLMSETRDRPLIIAVTNPPNPITDQEIIEGIHLEDRAAITPEKLDQKNHYKVVEKTFLVLEHYKKSPDQAELTISIPLGIDIDNRKTRETFRLLAAILDEGPHSPMSTFLKRTTRPNVYEYDMLLDESVCDLQVKTKLDFKDIAIFVDKVCSFFGDPAQLEFVREAFENFKHTRIAQIKDRRLDASDAASELIFHGEYLTQKQRLELIESVQLEDVISLLDAIIGGTGHINIMTLSGILSKAKKLIVAQQARKLADRLKKLANVARVDHSGRTERDNIQIDSIPD